MSTITTAAYIFIARAKDCYSVRFGVVHPRLTSTNLPLIIVKILNLRSQRISPRLRIDLPYSAPFVWSLGDFSKLVALARTIIPRTQTRNKLMSRLTKIIVIQRGGIQSLLALRAEGRVTRYNTLLKTIQHNTAAKEGASLATDTLALG